MTSPPRKTPIRVLVLSDALHGDHSVAAAHHGLSVEGISSIGGTIDALHHSRHDALIIDAFLSEMDGVSAFRVISGRCATQPVTLMVKQSHWNIATPQADKFSWVDGPVGRHAFWRDVALVLDAMQDERKHQRECVDVSHSDAIEQNLSQSVPYDVQNPSSGQEAVIDMSQPWRAAYREFLRRYLQRQLDLSGGNVRAAAMAAGAEYSSLYRRCKEFGLSYGSAPAKNR